MVIHVLRLTGCSWFVQGGKTEMLHLLLSRVAEVSERTFCVIATDSLHFILTGDIWNGDGVVDATDEIVRATG